LNLSISTGEDVIGYSIDFTRALEINPRLATAYNNRGNAKRGLGDVAGALADYDRALALDPRLAAAYINRGLTRLLQWQEAEAQRDFDRCLGLDASMEPQLELMIREARRRLRGLR
jgi:tetratricopeptide (TPR) repeat protein